MSLTGNLRTMDLPEVLQWIAGGKKTGTLQIDRGPVQKRIAFVDGIIDTSWSNDPRESLGQFLVRDALVTEEQLFKALLRQEKEGRLIGVILVGDGAVAEADLRRALQLKVGETIYDLFLWPEGQFEFKHGELPKPPGISVDLPVMGVIMEGMRRVDEWSRIREVFPTAGTSFKTPNGMPAEVTDREDRKLLELAQTGRTLAAIALETRRSEFDTASRAFELHQRGLLAVARIQDTLPVGDASSLIRELLSMGAARYEQKRYDKALEAYEQVLAVDRLNQDAKKGLISVVEARTRERAVRGVHLDQVPVLLLDFKQLTMQDLDAQEGFVVSRVNGQWDVQSILKLCPMREEDALMIFARLLERGVIELRKA
jgi:tetratricopeptide (TPR) repeat protein